MADRDVLDDVEDIVVESVYSYLKIAMPEATKDQARNMVGKIGVRIVFGKEVFNDAFKGKV